MSATVKRTRTHTHLSVGRSGRKKSDAPHHSRVRKSVAIRPLQGVDGRAWLHESNPKIRRLHLQRDSAWVNDIMLMQHFNDRATRSRCCVSTTIMACPSTEPSETAQRLGLGEIKFEWRYRQRKPRGERRRRDARLPEAGS